MAMNMQRPLVPGMAIAPAGLMGGLNMPRPMEPSGPAFNPAVAMGPGVVAPAVAMAPGTGGAPIPANLMAGLNPAMAMTPGVLGQPNSAMAMVPGGLMGGLNMARPMRPGMGSLAMPMGPGMGPGAPQFRRGAF